MKKCSPPLAIKDAENPPHSSQNGRHQEHKQQMLARMQEKKNPHTLLVGMQTSATTVESNMVVSQKTKNRTATAMGISVHRDMCTPNPDAL
jgi:hypothetical protein